MATMLESIMERVRRAFAKVRERELGGPTIPAWTTRVAEYRRWDHLYANSIYQPSTAGGMRETILGEIVVGYAGLTAAQQGEHRIVGHFNPAKQIVEVYQNCLGGRWGQELTVAPTVDGGSRQVNAKLTGAVGSIWAWSNLDTEKQVLQRVAANLGTVGLRIATSGDQSAVRRVFIQQDHPSRIVDFEADVRGNVHAVSLKYDAVQGLAQDAETVTIEEFFSDDLIMRSVDGKVELKVDNPLGVCPYVILRHADDGTMFGKPAHYGTEALLHEINYLISNQGSSILAHMWPQWFAAAAGNPPTSMPLGRFNVAYVKTDTGGPTPVLLPLVPQLDQASCMNFIRDLQDDVRERQPEMVLANIKALSGQSGETIAYLIKPAAQLIANARSQYEGALIRAIKIALSYGVLHSLFDLGAGMGSREQAQASYELGLEDFEFAPRPAIAPSAFETLKVIEAETARRSKNFLDASSPAAAQDLSHAERLRVMGYSEQQIQEIDEETASQDTIPSDDPDEMARKFAERMGQ